MERKQKGARRRGNARDRREVVRSKECLSNLKGKYEYGSLMDHNNLSIKRPVLTGSFTEAVSNVRDTISDQGLLLMNMFGVSIVSSSTYRYLRKNHLWYKNYAQIRPMIDLYLETLDEEKAVNVTTYGINQVTSHVHKNEKFYYTVAWFGSDSEDLIKETDGLFRQFGVGDNGLTVSVPHLTITGHRDLGVLKPLVADLNKRTASGELGREILLGRPKIFHSNPSVGLIHP